MLVLIDIGNQNLCNYLTVSKKCDKKYQEITDSKFVIKKDKFYFNINHNKYNIFIIVQYIIAHNVPFFVQYHENNNKMI